MSIKILLLVVGILLQFWNQQAAPPDSARTTVVVDDFESYRSGASPARWKFLSSKEKEFKPLEDYMGAREKFYVVEEEGNKFVRAFTQGESQRITLPNAADGFDWDLRKHPRLQWEWRALRLPKGAREDKVNDVGGALYISFDQTDWLGRPLSIKYTYSSTLPVGTVVSSGNVKVIVAASGTEALSKWVRIERNVVQDYKRVFGGEPPARPFSITLWSDSDNTKTVGEVDFDNIRLSK